MSLTGVEDRRCECGAELVIVNGKPWCAITLARFRAMYGEPRS